MQSAKDSDDNGDKVLLALAEGEGNLAKIIIQLTLALVPSLLLSFLPFQPSHHAADALTAGQLKGYVANSVLR